MYEHLLMRQSVFNQHITGASVDYIYCIVLILSLVCIPFGTLSTLLFKIVLLSVVCHMYRGHFSCNLVDRALWMVLFICPVLVADVGPRAACQAAGGHLARLIQTLSKSLWGTCCPSGGGEAWNETTPQQVTVQHDSMSKCADDNGQVWLLS